MTRSTDDVAYLTSIAEQLHEDDPPLADAMRRAIKRSGVSVLLGSPALVRHLDAAIRRIVENRFPLQPSTPSDTREHV